MLNDTGRSNGTPNAIDWRIDVADLEAIANVRPAGPGWRELPQTASAGPNDCSDLLKCSGACSDAVVFIDPSVTDVSAIVAAACADAEVVLLDPASDGLMQIARHLAKRPEMKAISLLASGCFDSINLGSAVISKEALSGTYGPTLAMIRSSLGGRAVVRCASREPEPRCQGCVVALLAKAVGAELVAS